MKERLRQATAATLPDTGCVEPGLRRGAQSGVSGRMGLAAQDMNGAQDILGTQTGESKIARTRGAVISHQQLRRRKRLHGNKQKAHGPENIASLNSPGWIRTDTILLTWTWGGRAFGRRLFLAMVMFRTAGFRRFSLREQAAEPIRKTATHARPGCRGDDQIQKQSNADHGDTQPTGEPCSYCWQSLPRVNTPTRGPSSGEPEHLSCQHCISCNADVCTGQDRSKASSTTPWMCGVRRLLCESGTREKHVISGTATLLRQAGRRSRTQPAKDPIGPGCR